MSLAVLTINDAGLQLAVDGELKRTSPGYAVLDGNVLLIGEEAARNAKLLPRWTNNRFWSQLDANPLTNRTDQIRHHADLAFHHLEDLWQSVANDSDRVILVVPGYYKDEQLGLLLGLAQAANVPIKGIVDKSVIAAKDLPLNDTILHLDGNLHNFTLSTVSNAGRLIRQSANTIIESGLFTLWDRWANVIAKQFIQTSRFDPLHNASSEQKLYDRVPAWISDLTPGATSHPFELEIEGTVHAVSIANDSLLASCAQVYPQIVQAIRTQSGGDKPCSLLVSHQLKGLPGLTESLQLIKNIDVQYLAETKMIGSATLHEAEIIGDSGAVNHVLQLSGSAISAETTGSQVTGQASASNQTQGQSTQPTHLLWRHQASAIGQSFKLDANIENGPVASEHPIATLYLRGGQMLLALAPGSRKTLLLNGEPVGESAVLNIGDVLTLDEEALTLIRVAPHG